MKALLCSTSELGHRPFVEQAEEEGEDARLTLHRLESLATTSC